MKYRKKPVVVKAIQWTGDNPDAINELCGISRWYLQHGALRIATLEGVMEASVGDYIIRGVNGELYPCKPDIFEKTYEEVSE
jgi:hypothetical protein